tara:strand:- start:25 stop:240 length:216 start_codon:yes stop_codon:yes gene_type:complete
MDYDLVIQLAKRVNQSETVCKAVRKFLNGLEEYKLADVKTVSLLASLQARFPYGTTERNLIDALIAMHMPS